MTTPHTSSIDPALPATFPWKQRSDVDAQRRIDNRQQILTLIRLKKDKPSPCKLCLPMFIHYR